MATLSRSLWQFENGVLATSSVELKWVRLLRLAKHLHPWPGEYFPPQLHQRS